MWVSAPEDAQEPFTKEVIYARDLNVNKCIVFNDRKPGIGAAFVNRGFARFGTGRDQLDDF